jgi:hypothetical protein
LEVNVLKNLQDERDEQEQRQAIDRLVRILGKSLSGSHGGDALAALAILQSNIIEQTIEPELWLSVTYDLNGVIVRNLYACDSEPDHGAMN